MKPIIIAGPCAVESEEQIIRIASKLKQLGIDYLRGGAFKPRTNPDDFQGLGELGIEYLIKAKQITGLPIVTELMSIEQVKKYAKDIDIIQVGSRNMYNYELLKELGKYNTQYLSRLEEEADIKKTIGEKLETNMFAYPVTLQHYVDLFWECGSTVGAGRGSSCSGLNHYLLGITQLDPIGWGLPFWRYLNKEMCVNKSL